MADLFALLVVLFGNVLECAAFVELDEIVGA
jgi:hypothetical protein